MPLGLVMAYLTMLPRLLAEEQIAGIAVARAPHLEEADLSRMLSDLERAKEGARKRKRVRATPADLAAMGVGFDPNPPLAPEGAANV